MDKAAENNRRKGRGVLKGHHIWTNTLFIKLSLLTVLLTIGSVLLAGMVPYIYLDKQMDSDVKQYNSQKLTYVKDTMDNMVFSRIMFSVKDFVVLDNMYDVIDEVSGKANYSGIKSLYELLNKKLASYTGIISNIALYYQEDEILLSTSSGVKFLKDTGTALPYDTEWIKYVNSQAGANTLQWIGTRDVPNLKYVGLPLTDKSFSLIVPLRHGAQEPIYACFSVSEELVVGLFDQINPDGQMGIYLVEQNGNAIVGTDMSDQIAAAISRLWPAVTSDKSLILDDKPSDTTLCVAKSEYTDWYYILAVPNSFYYQKNGMFSHLVLLACVIIALLVMIIGVPVILKMTYPFGRLVENVKSSFHSDASLKTKNDFNLLENAFTNLIVENDLQKNLLTDNRALMRQNLYQILLEGKGATPSDIETCMKFLGIRLDKALFTVVALRFNMMSDKTAAPDMGAFEAVLASCRQTGTVLDAEFLPVQYIGGFFSMVINYDETEALKLIPFCEKLNAALEDAMLSACCMGIGGTYKWIGDIHKTQNEAGQALRYAAYYPNIRLFPYEKTKTWDQNDIFDESLLTNLIRNINAHHADNVKFYLKALNTSITENHLAYPTTLSLVSRIIVTAEQVAKANKLDLGELFSRPLAEQINAYFFLSDIFKCLETTVTQILSYADTTNLNRSGNYAEKALTYLHNNYHKDISIQDIADELKISRYHLCRVFKETQNITLIEYLSELRMARAKELLETSNMNVNDIAEMVGFNNTAYFNKRFKQAYGVTPSQIRHQ
ncbi:MAG: AraC family transcriptional regulator [Clostridiaceae bacterium]|nr:AraC family transcriptional regulator [Clostridiaceae bacterium]